MQVMLSNPGERETQRERERMGDRERLIESGREPEREGETETWRGETR
jgi:hypothetical protein